jgi:hypothetical protein
MPPTIASTKASGSKASRSSNCSPVPMYRTGRPSASLMPNTAPPRAVPSSLATISPVTCTAPVNSFACWIAFWPFVPSRTSQVSCGAPGRRRSITRRILSSSAIKFV